MIPTFFRLGRSFLSNSTCFLTGDRSLVPVAKPPTCSIEATNFAETGSVTAVNKIGVLVDKFANA